MKVCFIASAFKPYATGGADVAAENSVDGLLDQGHEVVVITVSFWRGLKSLWPKIEPIPTLKGKLVVYRYYPINLFSFLTINNQPAWLRLPWHFIDMFNIHAWWVTRFILQRTKPEVVLTHNIKGVGYLSVRAAVFYAKKFNKKHIHTVHDVQLAVPSGRIIKGEENSWQNTGCLTKLYSAWCRFIFKPLTIVVSASQFLLDFYTERGFFPSARKVVVLNPLQLQSPAAYQPSHEGVVRFLYLGQLERHKGILFLLDVFKELLKRHPGRAMLLIAGSGALASEVKSMTDKTAGIKFVGWRERHELANIFVNIDATIFPSLCYENSPTIIGESLSFGVPVIAAQIGGVQLVQHASNGYLFQAGDKTDLLKVLQYCLNHQTELINMRSQALVSIQGLDVKSYLQKLLAL